MTTIFDLILSGEIACQKVYEDENTLAFHDIHPQAPVHVLIIPKRRIVNIGAADINDDKLLGQILLTAKKVSVLLNLNETGFRLVFNNGSDGGQTVDHLHCHLLGGRPMKWPPG